MSADEFPGETIQQPLAALEVKRRELPDPIPELEARCCWHCHNPATQMHILVCTDCGHETKSPVVQDEPLCRECNGLNECRRATWRIVEPEGGVSRAEGRWLQKRVWHPVTGRQLTPEAFAESDLR